jgi:hypothetical protein
MSKDNFLGAWLVTEYVYNPDGSFAGIIHQRRELEKLANGNIRVTQHCQPAPELADHVMGRFTGKPVFDLSVDGRVRHYHGPAVIGTGLTWGDGAMTGRGLWPDFGHNFTSFAIQPDAERQITGGKFFTANEMVANIVGIAVPESEGVGYPEFMEATTIYARWQGSIHQFDAQGKKIESGTYTRQYGHGTKKLYLEQSDIHEEEYLSSCGNGKYFYTDTLKIGESLQGIEKQYGWLREIEAVGNAGISLTSMEILDPIGKNIINIRQWYKNQQLEKVEIIRLTPQQ